MDVDTITVVVMLMSEEWKEKVGLVDSGRATRFPARRDAFSLYRDAIDYVINSFALHAFLRKHS